MKYTEDEQEELQQTIEETQKKEEQKKKKVKTAKIVGIIALGIIGLAIAAKVLLPNDTNSLIESLECTIYRATAIELDINKDGIVGHIWQTNDKPVIYVYNTTGKTKIQLTLNDTSTMTVEYPKHDELINNTYIWNVNTSMNGKLRTEDNEEYNYIFWEANTNEFNQQEFKDGFCIKGEETEKFLKESLKELNLTPTEYNDFIVYWLPKMQNNNYNIIRFCGIDESDTNDTYLKETQLTVYNNGKVIDNQLRVMMIWYSSDKPIEIKEQNLKDFAITRDTTTPTVIEWGGTEIKH